MPIYVISRDKSGWSIFKSKSEFKEGSVTKLKQRWINLSNRGIQNWGKVFEDADLMNTRPRIKYANPSGYSIYGWGDAYFTTEFQYAIEIDSNVTQYAEREPAAPFGGDWSLEWRTHGLTNGRSDWTSVTFTVGTDAFTFPKPVTNENDLGGGNFSYRVWRPQIQGRSLASQLHVNESVGIQFNFNYNRNNTKSTIYGNGSGTMAGIGNVNLTNAGVPVWVAEADVNVTECYLTINSQTGKPEFVFAVDSQDRRVINVVKWAITVYQADGTTVVGSTIITPGIMGGYNYFNSYVSGTRWYFDASGDTVLNSLLNGPGVYKIGIQAGYW